jgi:hypothetical protein
MSTSYFLSETKSTGDSIWTISDLRGIDIVLCLQTDPDPGACFCILEVDSGTLELEVAIDED